MKLIIVFLAISLLSTSYAEDRFALVIGNADYRSSALANPVNDARDFADALRDTGFKVTLLLNANQEKMERRIQAFGRKLHSDSVGLFYYSGHGVQYDGNNYLIPIGSMETVSAPEHLRYKTVDSGYVLSVMKQASNRLNIVILDACRSNPFKSFSRSMHRGLTRVSGVEGTIIAYSTAPGKVALDGRGNNSPYTQQLMKMMKQPGLPIELVLKRVRQNVKRDTNGKQSPWYEASIDGDFYFKSGTSNTNVAFNQPKPQPKYQPKLDQLKIPSSLYQKSGIRTVQDFINNSTLQFSDNFNGNVVHGWNNDGAFSINKGWYEIKGRDSKYNSSLINVPALNGTTDFLIQTRIKKLSGDNSHGFGMLWAAKDIYDLYGLYLNGDGSFVYGKLDDNKWKSITSWSNHSAIKKNNATNKIAIMKTNNQLKFFINGQLVYEGRAAVAKGSFIGFTTSKPSIKVDYLRIRTTQPVSQLTTASTAYGIDYYESNSQSLFYDNFNYKNGWVYDKRFQLNHGWYDISGRDADYNSTLLGVSKFNRYGDYLIKTRINKVSGKDNSGYGIIWGAKDSYNMYGLYLNGDGNFVYGELDNNKWKSITSWSKTSALKKYNAINKVAILKVKQQLKFYINDQLVYEGKAPILKGNKVGFTTSKPKIKVDYLSVKEIN